MRAPSKFSRFSWKPLAHEMLLSGISRSLQSSENWKYFYPERCFICDLERGVMLRMLEEGCNCWIVVMGSFPLAILISEGEVWHLFYFPAELCPLCFCGDFLRQCQHLCESEWDTWEWMSVALTERSDKSHESKMMKLQLLLFDL